jgi:hypothetical protein
MILTSSAALNLLLLADVYIDHSRCRDMSSNFCYQHFSALLSPHYCSSPVAILRHLQNQVPMPRTSFPDWVVCYVACLNLLLSHCHCIFYSPYQHLPLASFKSFNGTFGFPSGGTHFRRETEMTIRWSTDFAAVNLYVVYNASSIPPSPGVQKQLSSKHLRSTSHAVLLLT